MCSICEHEFRADIDRAIVAGDSLKSLAEKWHVSRDSLRSHKNDCMTRTDAALIAYASSKSQLASQPAEYETTVNLSHTASLQQAQRERLLRLSDLAEEVLLEVKAKGDARNFASNLTALRQTIESVCRPNPGETTLNIVTDVKQSAEWRAMMKLCRAHPELHDELLSYL